MLSSTSMHIHRYQPSTQRPSDDTRAARLLNGLAILRATIAVTTRWHADQQPTRTTTPHARQTAPSPNPNARTLGATTPARSPNCILKSPRTRTVWTSCHRFILTRAPSTASVAAIRFRHGVRRPSDDTRETDGRGRVVGAFDIPAHPKKENVQSPPAGIPATTRGLD